MPGSAVTTLHAAKPPAVADRERRQLRAIVEYRNPQHTHFVDLVEPLPPILTNRWELGRSDLGETRGLHRNAAFAMNGASGTVERETGVAHE